MLACWRPRGGQRLYAWGSARRRTVGSARAPDNRRGPVADQLFERAADVRRSSGDAVPLCADRDVRTASIDLDASRGRSVGHRIRSAGEYLAGAGKASPESAAGAQANEGDRAAVHRTGWGAGADAAWQRVDGERGTATRSSPMAPRKKKRSASLAMALGWPPVPTPCMATWCWPSTPCL